MALSKENVVVVYRSGDSESEEFAQRYKNLHRLSANQLLPIACSATEILADYATFDSEVETPILSGLSSSPLSNYTIHAIVLMPRVPGGFIDGSHVISATSRLSRIHHSFSREMRNPLYDRKTFKRFDSSDADLAIICTRFDSPLAAITKQWFDNTERAMRQFYASGEFFFDPYSALHNTGSDQYEAEMIFFYDSLLQRLGLTVQSTVQVDPYIDPVIGSVKDDSFYWGWGADRGSLSYFKTTRAMRAFFYNADFDGAATMRNVDATTWPLLAIRKGYTATAGAMSNPGIGGFLRPYPFFNALFRGATLGEAMLFSVPHLDWTMAFFGDPLLKIGFPVAFEENDLIPFDNAWQTMADYTAQSVINIYEQNASVQEMWEYVLGIDDVQVALDLYEPMTDLRHSYPIDDWKNVYIQLARRLFDFVTVRNKTTYVDFYPKLTNYLQETGNKVSSILLDVIRNRAVPGTIPDENIEEPGSWDFEFDLEHYTTGFAFYHFILEVSDSMNFYNPLFTKSSLQSPSGWSYENSEGDFVPLPNNGLTSNYEGKRVRYSSNDDEALQRGTYYYFRITEKDQLSSYAPRVYSRIIYR